MYMYKSSAHVTVHSINHDLCHSGILLKDLVAVDSQSKDYSDSSLGMVNMNKYKLLWTILSTMRHAQLTPPKTPPDIEHMRILRVS